MSKMSDLHILQEENEMLQAENVELQGKIARLENDKCELSREYVLLKGKLNFVKKYGMLNLKKFISEN